MDAACPEKQLSTTASIALSLWFSLSGLAAVAGNAVVLWLFYKSESLRTISNRFLASLSVADLFVGLVIDPIWIASYCLIQPSADSDMLFFTDMLWVHTTTATTFCLCCVSVDRFIAIRFPFRYQEIITKKRCYTVITLVWLFSLALPFSMMLVNNDEDDTALWLSFAFLIYVTPLFVVSVSYIFMLKEARQQLRRIAPRKNYLNHNNRRVRIVKNYKAIKTVGIVLGVYVVSWMPSLILLLVQCYHLVANNLCESDEIDAVVWPWVEAIAFTSSAINPLIYYFRNKEFRLAFRRTFRWLR